MDHPFVCPRCKKEVTNRGPSFDCARCSASFPIVAGIPDFRLEAGPYLTLDEDRATAHQLLTGPQGFEELLNRYMELDRLTTPQQWKRFRCHALNGVMRGALYLKEMPPTPDDRFVEIGCRSGGGLLAASKWTREVWGIDIALRWLVIARQRLQEVGVRANLICCSANALPFEPGFFDYVYLEDTLQYISGPSRALEEVVRVLTVDGRLNTTIWNRFCLLPEPHVHLWGVGILPAGIRERYVRLWTDGNYAHVHLLSAPELKRLLSHFPEIEYDLLAGPVPVPSTEKRGWKAPLISLLECLRKVPVLSLFLLALAPIIMLRGRKIRHVA